MFLQYKDDDNRNQKELNADQNSSGGVVKISEKQFAMDVLMLLDDNAIETLRHTFTNHHRQQQQQHGESGLSKFEFVQAICGLIRTRTSKLKEGKVSLTSPTAAKANYASFARSPMSLNSSRSVVSMLQAQYNSPSNATGGSTVSLADEPNLILNLCELFDIIDVTGQQTITFDDFTTYLIQTAMLTHYSHERIRKYEALTSLMNASRDEIINRLCYFPEIDRIVTCGRIKKCKLLNPQDFSVVAVLAPDHNGYVLNAEYHKEADMIITTAADCKLRFWTHDSLEPPQAPPQPQSGAVTEQPILSAPGPVSVLEMAESQMIVRQYANSRLMSGSRTGTMSILSLQNLPPIESIYSKELRSLTDEQILCSRKLHSDVITDMAASMEMRRLTTSSLDSTIKLYDIEKDTVYCKFTGHEKGVFSISYSNTYNFLLSAGCETEAFVWVSENKDATPFRLSDNRMPHETSLLGVYAVPGTPQVITADSNGMFKLWDVRTFRAVQTFYADAASRLQPGINTQLTSFTYVTSTNQIAAIGKKISLFQYEKTERPEHADDSPLMCAVYNSAALSFMTVAGRDVKIWDALSGSLTKEYNDITESEITAVCLDSVGRKFFVGTHTGEVMAFHYANGCPIKTYGPHSGEVTSLSYSKKHRTVISTSWDRTVRILSDSDSLRSIGVSGDAPITMQISGAGGSSVMVTGDVVHPFGGYHNGDIRCSAVSPSLSLFVTGDVRRSVFVWDMLSNNKICRLTCPHGEVVALCFLHKFPAFVCADSTGQLSVFSVRPHHTPYTLLLKWCSTEDGVSCNRDVNIAAASMSTTAALSTSAVCCMDFDRRSLQLYTGDDRGIVTVWDLSSLISSCRLRPSHYPLLHTVEESQKRAASASKYHHLESNVASAPSVSVVKRWLAHSESIKSLQYISEPQSVLTASADSEVIIWDIDGNKMCSLQQSVDPLQRIPFRFPIDITKHKRARIDALRNMFDITCEQEPSAPQQQIKFKNVVDDSHATPLLRRAVHNRSTNDSSFLAVPTANKRQESKGEADSKVTIAVPKSPLFTADTDTDADVKLLLKDWLHQDSDDDEDVNDAWWSLSNGTIFSDSANDNRSASVQQVVVSKQAPIPRTAPATQQVERQSFYITQQSV